MPNQETFPSAQDLLDAIYDPEGDGVNDSVRYGFVVECFDRLVAAAQDQKTPVQGGATKEQIEAEAWERFPELADEYRSLTYPAEAMRTHNRAAFASGATWASALPVSASADPADEHHDAEERQAEGDLCSDCADKMEYVGTPDGSSGYLHCWRCWYREHPQAESEDHAATVTGDREKLIAEAVAFAKKERDQIRARFKQTGAANARVLGYADACEDLIGMLSTALATQVEPPADNGKCGGCRDLGPHRNVRGCDFYDPTRGSGDE